MAGPLRHRNSARRYQRPPGPSGLPLLGSLFEARRDPLRFVQTMARTHGDIAHYRIATYTGYHVNHPDYIQHVLQGNHRNYSKANYNYEMLKPVLGEGLITSTGDEWLHQRRLMQPAFHRERLARFGSVATRATLDMLERWDVIAARGQPLDAWDEMMRLTLRIVGESLFSVKVGAGADTIGTAFTVLNEDVAYRLRDVVVPPLWVPTKRNRAFKNARAQLDAVVYAMIRHRQEAGDPRDDLLGMLLEARDRAAGEGMSDRQVRDEVMTLLLAGHETTALLLVWTWYLLATHPPITCKLRNELDTALAGRLPTVDDLAALEYTEMVLHESLRLHPPVWIISRRAIDDDEIGGYPIPAGSNVTVSPYTMHRHPAFWTDPQRVEPERFAPERAAGRHRYAYLPFGGGPRYCIGSHFAMMEAQLILATVSQRYRLTLLPDQVVEPEPLVTLRPRHGLKMRLQARS